VKLARSFLAAIRLNMAEVWATLSRSNYWNTPFLGFGSITVALLLFYPGDTLSSYYSYTALAWSGDYTLGVVMAMAGLWAIAARTTRSRRNAAILLAALWGALFWAITLGVYHHVATHPGIGPSLAPVHYLYWALHAIMTVVRTTEEDATENGNGNGPHGGPPVDPATTSRPAPRLRG
jgi:hypothetical protein